MRGVRKLACISIGFSAAIFAAHYILPLRCLYPLALTCALCSLAGLLLRDNARRRFILIILSVAVGFAAYRLHYENTVAVCDPYDGKTLQLNVRVLDYPSESDYGYNIYARITDRSMPRVKILLFDYARELSDLKPGDVLLADCKLRSASLRYGVSIDKNISDGIYLTATVSGSYTVGQSGEGLLRYLPQHIAQRLRQQIKLVFPDDASPFMTALLTGDKSEYYVDDELSSAMSIAGLAHIVAVSGMHVSFLVAFVQMIFGRTRKVSWLCILVIWLFVLMSGSSPSAVRAGFMLTVYLIAPIAKRENDRATTLSFALAVLLVQNPFACASVSLQLSFAAIAGIFLFTKAIYNYADSHTPGSGRLKLYVLSAFSNSVAVSVFSLPVIAAHFGYVPLLSPITNILCLWTVAILFIGGYFVCILGFPLLTAASFLGAILSYLVRYIALIVKLMAKLPFAALYTRNGYALLWLILVYLVFALTYFARDKSKKYSPLLPAALSVVSLVSVFFWTDLSMRRDGGTANILDVGSGQCIVLTQGEHAAVIDCGSKGTTQQAGSEASDLLHSLGRTKIDVLLLTHIHSDHADGAARLLNRVKVKNLLLPANAAENADEALLREILHAAEQNSTEILYIDCDTYLSAGDIGLNIYAPFPKGDKNERGLMLSAKVGGRTVLITGDVSTTTEQKLVLSQPLEDTDILLVGHHGSKYSTCEALLQEAAPEISVISVGYNSYGHPTDEVLARLRDAGTQILRTDESGNIQIICGD